ncbi:MAG TPA: MerR family transcriptional regulator [Chitinophagaceae bacterium]|jgi:DNA-binding transcriptional MerR regulator|nr:MerR family transcriptional regulator [Chitinophagaceae bacterium]
MGKTLPQIAFDFSTPETTEQPEDVLAASRQRIAAAQTENKTVTEVPPVKKEKPVSVRGRRSLKDIAQDADLVQVPNDEILFQKQYYSIGEVAGWFRVNQSLLRYWETEFDVLQPRKNRKGDRFFRPADVKNLQLIYDLLRRRKFTIEGAKEYLKNNKRAEEKFEMIRSLEKIKAFLNELKASL